MDMNQEQQKLAGLLRGAIECVIDVASNHKLGPAMPTIQYEITWMEPQSERRSISKREVRSEDSFASVWLTLENELNDIVEIKGYLNYVTQFAKEHGKFLRLSLIPHSLGEALLSRYFEYTGELRVDEDVIKNVIHEFVGDMTAENASVTAVFHVEDFFSECPFNLDEAISFRPITMTDISFYGRLPLRGEAQHWLNIRDWICEIKRSISKNDTNAYIYLQEIVDNIAAALNLTVKGRAAFFLLREQITSPFLSVGWSRGGVPQFTSSIGPRCHLADADIERFRGIFEKVRNVSSNENLSYLRLPLRRLRLSASRREAEDHFIDRVIALERLLARDTPTLETTFRFRLRGAALLPARFGSSRDRYDLMKKIYALRSKIVHGNAEAEEIAQLGETTEDVLREIMLWALEKGASLGGPGEIISAIDTALIDGGERLR